MLVNETCLGFLERFGDSDHQDMAAEIRRLRALHNDGSVLFRRGRFRLNNGEESWFKIDCDALSDEDLDTLALLVAEDSRVGTFHKVEGVPTGGLRFAKALERYALSKYTDAQNPRVLIVDDVLTTGGSMERQRAGRDRVQGVVIFARGKCPDWVVPLFQMDILNDGPVEGKSNIGESAP